MLFSQTEAIDISFEQLSILHTLLNSRIPTTLSSNLFLEAINKINENNYNISFTPHHLQLLGESLDTISDKENHDTSKPGLRHFSLWNVSDNSDELNKEFNRNTFGNDSHSITNTKITCDTKHYLGEILKKNGCNYKEGTRILGVYPFSKVAESVKDLTYFDKIGITKEQGTLVVVFFRYKDEKKIACLYIHSFLYSIFVSPELICKYISLLCEFPCKENTFKQNQIFQQLIGETYESETEEVFYANATDYLKKMNEAEACLIYMYNEKGILLQKGTPPLPTIMPKFTFSAELLPKPYSDDKRFCDWLNNVPNNRKPYYVNEDFGCKVKSALLVQASASERRIMGYILLLNKRCTQPCESAFVNNIFLRDNYKLSKICGLVFSQYQQLRNSIGNKNYMLSKLRHEIPSNTDAIINGIQIIKTGLREKTIRENYLLTVAHNIELNNSRVMMLANFFTTVDFPRERFAEKKVKVNIYRFLNSYIELFRVEGQYRGVDVYFIVDDSEHFILVSNYYLLAIVNIITNAIRYSAVGTSVVIEVTKDSIIVSDLGIPISNNDMEHIYDEGFRSRNARRICEKGMGYGLYLSKMILEAHGSVISAQCCPCSETNVFAQKIVYDYIQALTTQMEREKFIYNGLSSYEYHQADKSLSQISSVIINPIYNKYINKKPELIYEWMKYYRDNNYAFIDFEHTIFSEPIYEVIFKITI